MKESHKTKYTKAELASIVSALIRMYKRHAICVDRDEEDSVIGLERTGRHSLLLKMINGFESDSVDYTVNADTLIACDVRKEFVCLKLREYGDSLAFRLHFMDSAKPEGFPECCC